MCFRRSWYKITTFQKIIKYLALAFAIYLIYLILTIIITVGRGITGSVIKNDDNRKPHIVNVDGATNYLDVSLSASDLLIKTGDKFKVETDSDTIKVKEENNQITVTETGRWRFGKKASNVTVTIPKDMKLDNVYIETGAGKVSIDEIKTSILNLELGAGKISIDNIESDKTNIETGAGELTIKNGILNNAKIDCGLGSINITAQITGNSKIEAGVGSVNIDLLATLNDYRIEFEKGLGSINYNGNNIKKSESTVGNGANFIKIEGGIGSIRVNTKSAR